MKLKRLVQAAIIGCGILAMAACSSSHKNAADEASMNNDMNGGAQAMGMGDNSGFGGNAGSEASARKNTYYFDFDRSNVRQEDKPSIFANADYLVAHPNAKVIVEGHTDPRGSREYNVALGEHRANAVADLLRSKGVGSNQIRVVSYGAERLAATGHSDSDYQLDRRAVIAYTRR